MDLYTNYQIKLAARAAWVEHVNQKGWMYPAAVPWRPRTALAAGLLALAVRLAPEIDNPCGGEALIA